MRCCIAVNNDAVMYSYISKSSTTYWVWLSGNSVYKASLFYVSTILCGERIRSSLLLAVQLAPSTVQQPVVAVPDAQA